MLLRLFCSVRFGLVLVDGVVVGCCCFYRLAGRVNSRTCNFFFVVVVVHRRCSLFRFCFIEELVLLCMRIAYHTLHSLPSIYPCNIYKYILQICCCCCWTLLWCSSLFLLCVRAWVCVWCACAFTRSLCTFCSAVAHQPSSPPCSSSSFYFFDVVVATVKRTKLNNNNNHYMRLRK